MSASAPDLVIFDFDGVLIDSEAIALAELAALMTDLGVAIDIAGVRDRFLGNTIATAADWAAARGAGLRGEAFAEAWYARLFARYETELRPMPGQKPCSPRSRRQASPSASPPAARCAALPSRSS